MEVAKFSILVDFRVWGLLGTICSGGGCFYMENLLVKMEVDPHSTAKFSILVDLRVWGLLGTILLGGLFYMEIYR